MTYLNLTSTPNTELTDPQTALNANWDEIDEKFGLLNSHSSPVGSSVSDAEVGIEFVSSETDPPEIAVFTEDSAFKKIQTEADETWGAWTNINLASGFSAVTSRTPQLKISNFGRVVVRGAVQYNSGAAWPSDYQKINSGQFDTTVATRTVCRDIAATPSGGTGWAFAQFYISLDSGNPTHPVIMWIVYSGTSLGANNRVSLDGLWWFL